MCDPWSDTATQLVLACLCQRDSEVLGWTPNFTSKMLRLNPPLGGTKMDTPRFQQHSIHWVGFNPYEAMWCRRILHLPALRCIDLNRRCIRSFFVLYPSSYCIPRMSLPFPLCGFYLAPMYTCSMRTAPVVFLRCTFCVPSAHSANPRCLLS